MRIKVKRHPIRTIGETYKANHEYDVPADRAELWIHKGWASAVTNPEPQEISHDLAPSGDLGISVKSNKESEEE